MANSKQLLSSNFFELVILETGFLFAQQFVTAKKWSSLGAQIL